MRLAGRLALQDDAARRPFDVAQGKPFDAARFGFAHRRQATLQANGRAEARPSERKRRQPRPRQGKVPAKC